MKSVETENTFKEVCCTLSKYNFIVDVEDLKPNIPVDSEIEGYCTDNELQTLIQNNSNDTEDVVMFSKTIPKTENEVKVKFGVSAKYRRYSLQEMHNLRKLCTEKPKLSQAIMNLVGKNSDDKKRSSSASKATESKQMIRVNLSLKEDIKLNESSDAWKPTMNDLPAGKIVDLQTMVKKIRGILNRLTEENFEILSSEATKFTIQTTDEIKSVMILMFEKAIGEPNFAPLYAKFCHAIFANANQSRKMDFIKILLEHTQEEFNTNVDNSNAINAKLEPINERLKNCENEQHRAEIKAELDEQEYLFRRRAWGTVRLIGELFNYDILKPKVVMECLQKLLDTKCEEKLEYLCKMLATVGKKLEKTIKDTTTGQTYSSDLNKIFNSMHDIVSPKRTKGKSAANSCKLSSRVHFMLLDSIDLKRNQWQKGNTLSPNVISRKQVVAELENSKIQQKPVKSMKIVPIKTKTNFGTSLLESNNDRKKTIPFDSKKLNFNTDVIKELGNSSQFMWNVAGSTINTTQNVSAAIVVNKVSSNREEELEEEVIPSIVVTDIQVSSF